MKKFIPVIILLIALAAAISYGHRPAKNPDPNHNHADFAVWMPIDIHPNDGSYVVQKLDFSAEKYMTKELTAEQLAALETQTATGSKLQVLKQYLHLHDGNGYVIHRHKPGLSIGDFFSTIGAQMKKTQQEGSVAVPNDCFLWTDLKDMENISCNGEWGFTLHMFVNGKEVTYNPDYAFNDGDKILLIATSANDNKIQTALSQMTDDACLYSRTCPWRGPAPTENCIADPTVPCVEVH